MSEKLDRRRVLLADDYPGMHSALTRLLAPWCDVVGGIDDAAGLLDAIARLRPDVVVLDLSMPGVDGLQACRQIKSVKPDVNVIVCTAADEPWLAAKVVEAGASAFVLKCRIGDDLVRAIQTTRSVRLRRTLNHMDRTEDLLRDLGRRLIEAHESERRRLSRELHDNLGQRLALLSAELVMLRETLGSSPLVVDQLDKLLAYTVDLGTEVHRLSHDLHPAWLEHTRLPDSVRRVCTDLSRAYRIPIHLECVDVPVSLSNDIALCLYRIVQEALHNVVKHSAAASASVRLETHGGEIVLTVVDDGRGFDPLVEGAMKGVGLISMRERTRLVDGSVVLTSQPGLGTRVEVRLPLVGSSTGDRRQATPPKSALEFV